jgi:hypothetical protein
MWSQGLLHIRTLILSLFIAALHKKGILNFVSSVLPCLFYLAATTKRRATKIMTVASAAHFSICFAPHALFFCLFHSERASENRALALVTSSSALTKCHRRFPQTVAAGVSLHKRRNATFTSWTGERAPKRRCFNPRGRDYGT